MNNSTVQTHEIGLGVTTLFIKIIDRIEINNASQNEYALDIIWHLCTRKQAQ